MSDLRLITAVGDPPPSFARVEEPTGDEHVRWARESYAALEPFATGRTYVNFLADEGQARVRAAYGEERYARLVALKRAHDPDNVLRLNQNIDPGGLHSAA